MPASSRDPLLPNRPTAPLIRRAKSALGMTHRQLGPALGASKRQSARWFAREAELTVPQLKTLAKLLYPRDPTLAAEVAAAASESLESLGLVVRPAYVPPTPLVVDAIVCAAADAMNAPPASARAGLLAALRRAHEIGLDSRALEKALAPPA